MDAIEISDCEDNDDMQSISSEGGNPLSDYI
jgi:hypothetical protein